MTRSQKKPLMKAVAVIEAMIPGNNLKGDRSITGYLVGVRKCNHCLKTDGSLMACGSCKIVHYCSQRCQKKDWKKHKPKCEKYL